jgi:hypothetical protein
VFQRNAIQSLDIDNITQLEQIVNCFLLITLALPSVFAKATPDKDGWATS